MVLSAKGEKEYVDMYLSAIKGIVGMTPRELDVASAMILRYKLFLAAQKKLKTKEAKKNYDPMKELKSQEVLLNIVGGLGMSFEVFRNYLTSLKSKGFFDRGTINPAWIADGESISITIKKNA